MRRGVGPWVGVGVTLALIGCEPTKSSSEETGSQTTPGAADADQDGVPALEDCDDSREDLYPGADDRVGDGVDQNCDGLDGVDADADGVASLDSGGEDCDDLLPSVNPYATDIVDTGVDQNCDGVDGTDADGDGFASEASGGDDCDDQLPSVNPAAADIVDSGIDQDCDGIDGVDADGDQFASEASGGDDCDDLDPTFSPTSEDLVGDGLDQSCDGVDGVDADGDTFPSEVSGGADCDDAEALTFPGTSDLGGDGIDANCDGVDGVDADGDGFASVATQGSDCDDADAAFYPGAADTVGDGLDQSCDFVDGVDLDHDGVASVDSGGTDCDDADAAVSPSVDVDLDGASACDDCDDADAARFPGNLELCNLLDDDCDALVDFAGTVDACARSVATVVGDGGLLDVLFVVDNSCSMADDQGKLRAAADDFLGPLDGVDWHVGVVTTDMDDVGHRGRLQPGPDGSRWVDDADDLTAATAWLRGAADQGTLGSPVERPLDASVSALDLLAATDNAGFSRPDADLAVIFVTDEPDYSATIPADWETWFSDLQVDRVATVHGIDIPTLSTQVSTVVGNFGGIEVDAATGDWGNDVAAIAAAIHPGPAFDGAVVLGDLPDPATIVVTVTEPGGAPTVLVDGVDYVYDVILNAVVMTGYLPMDGTEILVEYRALP